MKSLVQASLELLHDSRFFSFIANQPGPFQAGANKPPAQFIKAVLEKIQLIDEAGVDIVHGQALWIGNNADPNESISRRSGFRRRHAAVEGYGGQGRSGIQNAGRNAQGNRLILKWAGGQ
ncbi:MAG: hypothetical protein R6V60_10670 [Desulfobacterales bacterium]|jgi:hypothetical protein